MHLSNVDGWTVIAWGIAGAWIVAMAAFVQGFRKRNLLRPLDAREVPAAGPRLSVIVAARNESECIETCLRSLLRQDYHNFEVVAVNDRSTDDTGAILDRLALEFAGRLRVVHVSALPAGWFGKPHALTRGLERATGSLICFTDADCEFDSPAALRTTVAEVMRRDLDFFTVAAKYTMTSHRERVAVPCCCEAILTWLRPERMEDSDTPNVFANGAFILVRRVALDQIGGWWAVRSQISEDLHLARLAKQSGLRVGCAQGAGLYRTRSYASFRDSWNGWSRIFNGTLSPAQLLMTLCRMLVMFALPLGSSLWSLAVALRTGNFEILLHPAELGFAVALGLRCILDVTIFRMVGAPVAAVLMAPLGRLFVMAVATRALLSHAGLVHTHWRGATFAAGQMVMPRPAQPESRIPETRAAPVAVPHVTA